MYRTFALVLTLMTAAFGIFVAEAAEPVSIARAPAPGPVVLPDALMQRSVQDGATVLRIDGIITATLEHRLAEALASTPSASPVVVELSSPGGLTAAGYRIIDRILAERRAGRSIATRVRAGEACESMCVGVYLAGYPRYAAPNAVFMVHAPRMAENGHMTVRSTQAMVERLVSLGASTRWIERVRGAGGFSGARDYRETASDLSAEGSGIVTHLLR